MNLLKKRIIAITGPSGVGKTTLGDKLSIHNDISIPYHCTTRKKRNDDKEGFYRYLSHEQYKYLFETSKFLISSGDGMIISPEYGNFYGVLLSDCLTSWMNSDIIILFVSYKDIDTLIWLKKIGINIDIVNLRFKDIANGVFCRLSNNVNRNHTVCEIDKRIISALDDNKKYGEMVAINSECIIYTDEKTIEETYNDVCNKLKIRKLKK